MVVIDVCSAGLSTQVLPVARMGPSFQAAISSGKFQGKTQPTTPIGSRTTIETTSAPVGVISSLSLSVASACHRIVLIVSTRSISAVSVMGLPPSSVSMVASSVVLASMSVGEPLEQELAVGRGHVAPRTLEGGPGRGHGPVDVLGPAPCDLGQLGAGRRVEGGEAATVRPRRRPAHR